MTKSLVKLVMDDSGSYLGMEKGCFILKDKQGSIQKYPLLEQDIEEVILKTGNSVSTGALASCGFWDIDVMILTQRGRPVAMLRSFDDDSYVQTRVAQYQASIDERAYKIAKSFAIGKLEGQNALLEKYGFEPHRDNFREAIEGLESKSLELLRRRLTGIEGKHTQRYYQSLFKLIPEKIRPATREGFLAYDGTNNTFNLAYEVLAWKIQVALVRAKLEPYLGFLHANEMAKRSLVCDFQELYRYLIDDFMIGYCQGLDRRDFVVKEEVVNRRRSGKRLVLNKGNTSNLFRELDEFFETVVEVKRVRNGEHQTLETLINEESGIFARYIRGELNNWFPRIPLDL